MLNPIENQAPMTIKEQSVYWAILTMVCVTAVQLAKKSPMLSIAIMSALALTDHLLSKEVERRSRMIAAQIPNSMAAAVTAVGNAVAEWRAPLTTIQPAEKVKNA